ncbi:MAG: RloB family protein [Roseiarcus sp.]
MARKKGKRPPYPRMLIVTEGEKTEPLYFEEIRRELRLNAVHVAVAGSVYGTEPRQVVDYAVDLFLQRRKEFDLIFAVFDRDQHGAYHEALNTCLSTKLTNDEKKRVELCAVPSNPCFELWLLLHYENIHDLFHRTEIVDKLKRHIADYEKGLAGTFARTRSAVSTAIGRAKRLQQRYRPEQDTEGPYTNVHAIVELLLSIRRPV